MRLVKMEEVNNIPALFLFGDSMADTGNNNRLFTLARADFSPYGTNFVDSVPTGRFTDGLLGVDYLALLLELPLVPPYVDAGDNILHGVCFASGGSGILETTGQFYGQHIPLSKQISNFNEVKGRLRTMVGVDQASLIISKSLYLIVSGSNDFFSYYRTSASLFSSSSSENTSQIFPPNFQGDLLSNMLQQIQSLYALGARKIVVFGVPAVGCVPSMLNKNQGQCASSLNDAVQIYNAGLKARIKDMQANYSDAHLVYGNAFDLAKKIVANPESYGLSEAQTACCGWGEYRGATPCMPLINSVCTNASQHVFWDYVHPTSAAYHVIVQSLWAGSDDVITPLNLQKLSQLV